MRKALFPAALLMLVPLACGSNDRAGAEVLTISSAVTRDGVEVQVDAVNSFGQEDSITMPPALIVTLRVANGSGETLSIRGSDQLLVSDEEEEPAYTLFDKAEAIDSAIAEVSGEDADGVEVSEGEERELIIAFHVAQGEPSEIVLNIGPVDGSLAVPEDLEPWALE